MIDRIDILTGGASAVYGADAVAGVVNFVLNTHFQGVTGGCELRLLQPQQLAIPSPKARSERRGHALPPNSVNTGFGKNASVSHGIELCRRQGQCDFLRDVRRADAVLEGKYDYGGCTLDAAKPNNLHCGGSGTSAKNGAGGYFQAYSTRRQGALYQHRRRLDGAVPSL